MNLAAHVTTPLKLLNGTWENFDLVALSPLRFQMMGSAMVSGNFTLYS